MRPELSQEQKSTFVSTIQEETERLSELVSNFLDFSRLESGREQFVMEPVDLLALCNECALIVTPKAHDKNITIEVKNRSSYPIVIKTDRNKLKQVLFNLLSNGIKYNNENGSVCITLSENDNIVSISVQDTGGGIAEKDLDSLFHKYYRADDVSHTIQGTGLGLAICKKIIDNLNGNIDIQSTVNIGTQVTISIPKKG
jgi:two-component system phosphate regulon sensor histidine kinase PhoR